MTWRTFANWAKTNPAALRVAGALGRGRGRTRLLDRLRLPPPAPHRPDLSGWENRSLSAAWLGQATVLLRIGETTILTDPVFSNCIGLGMGLFTAGPRRYVAPALAIDELPPIDLIIVSHAHFDHLDRPTLARLPKRTRVITSHHNSDLIRDLGYRNVAELRWGESMQLGPIRVTAQKIIHWGPRTFTDVHRGYAAFLIDDGRRRVLFGGDTAYHDYFAELKRIDLAILGIGAYDPFIAAHASPEQAWKMADHMRADLVLPMHHSTFRLSHEPMHEPLERLLGAAGAHAEDRIALREIGHAWRL